MRARNMAWLLPNAALAALAVVACGGDGSAGPATLAATVERDFVEVLDLRTADSRTVFDVGARVTDAYPCETYIHYAYEGGTEFMEGHQGTASRTVMQGDRVLAFLGGRRFADPRAARLELERPNWFSHPPCVAVEEGDTMLHVDFALLATLRGDVVLGRIDPADPAHPASEEVPLDDVVAGLRGARQGDREAEAKIRGLTLRGWEGPR